LLGHIILEYLISRIVRRSSPSANETSMSIIIQ
jgi:hypothetical protein